MKINRFKRRRFPINIEFFLLETSNDFPSVFPFICCAIPLTSQLISSGESSFYTRRLNTVVLFSRFASSSRLTVLIATNEEGMEQFISLFVDTFQSVFVVCLCLRSRCLSAQKCHCRRCSQSSFILFNCALCPSVNPSTTIWTTATTKQIKTL